MSEEGMHRIAFYLLGRRLQEARECAVALDFGEHFISDIDHLRAVVKANEEEYERTIRR